MRPLTERQLRERAADEQMQRQAEGLGYVLVIGTRGQFALGIPDPHKDLAPGGWIDVTNHYDPDSHGGEVDRAVYGTRQQVVAWLDAEQQMREEGDDRPLF